MAAPLYVACHCAPPARHHRFTASVAELLALRHEAVAATVAPTLAAAAAAPLQLPHHAVPPAPAIPARCNLATCIPRDALCSHNTGRHRLPTTVKRPRHATADAMHSHVCRQLDAKHLSHFKLPAPTTRLSAVSLNCPQSSLPLQGGCAPGLTTLGSTSFFTDSLYTRDPNQLPAPPNTLHLDPNQLPVPPTTLLPLQPTFEPHQLPPCSCKHMAALEAATATPHGARLGSERPLAAAAPPALSASGSCPCSQKLPVAA
jgi:hypothetical protein